MGIIVDMQHEHVEVASRVALPSRNPQRHRRVRIVVVVVVTNR